MLTVLIVFGSGVAVGSVYTTAIRSYRDRAVKAAKAAAEALKD